MLHINLKEGWIASIHDFALRRFIKIVQDHANIKSMSVKCYQYQHDDIRYINRDYKSINKILGTDFEDNFIDNILEDLGFSIGERLKNSILERT